MCCTTPVRQSGGVSQELPKNRNFITAQEENMAKDKKVSTVVRRPAARADGALQLLFRKIWAGIGYIWKRPIILSAVLLILAIFLFDLLLKQTFVNYLKCTYLLNTQLGIPAFFCTGHDVEFLGASIFKIPGLAQVIDPPLEFSRKVITWGILIFFAFVSLYLTIIINNLKAVVKLLTFDKAEWKKFIASLRTWLLIFVSFCLLFYFTVIR
jgi:hypothetical protein